MPWVDDLVVTVDDLIGDVDTAAWFLPPSFLYVAPLPRIAWADRSPETPPAISTLYRMLVRDRRGLDVVVGGVTYQGGRWTGPLTDQQHATLTAAGYADRIVYAQSQGDLPAGID